MVFPKDEVPQRHVVSSRLVYCPARSRSTSCDPSEDLVFRCRCFIEVACGLNDFFLSTGRPFEIVYKWGIYEVRPAGALRATPFFYSGIMNTLFLSGGADFAVTFGRLDSRSDYFGAKVGEDLLQL